MCERLCILFDGNKMGDVEEPFLFLPVTKLKQCGIDKWDIVEVIFTYLNITSANFQPDSYSHFAGSHTYINE